MSLIVAAVKLIHFNLDFLMITPYSNIIIIRVMFRDTAYVMELNTASSPSLPVPSVSYATAFAVRKS